MKNKKKLTIVQKLERKFKRKTLSLLKDISTLSKEKSNLKERYEDLFNGFSRMKDSCKEQERIIDMFKSCIDKSILEKVLRDDYIVFLKAMYPNPPGFKPPEFKPMFDNDANEGPSFKYEVPK